MSDAALKPMKERHPFFPLGPEQRLAILRANAATLVEQAKECERLSRDDHERFYLRMFAAGIEEAVSEYMPMREAAE